MKFADVDIFICQPFRRARAQCDTFHSFIFTEKEKKNTEVKQSKKATYGFANGSCIHTVIKEE